MANDNENIDLKPLTDAAQRHATSCGDTPYYDPKKYDPANPENPEHPAESFLVPQKFEIDKPPMKPRAPKSLEKILAESEVPGVTHPHKRDEQAFKKPVRHVRSSRIYNEPPLPLDPKRSIFGGLVGAIEESIAKGNFDDNDGYTKKRRKEGPIFNDPPKQDFPKDAENSSVDKQDSPAGKGVMQTCMPVDEAGAFRKIGG